MWFAAILPMAPVHTPPTDGNFNKYMPRVLKQIILLALPHFWPKKNSCHALWRGTRVRKKIKEIHYQACSQATNTVGRAASSADACTVFTRIQDNSNLSPPPNKTHLPRQCIYPNLRQTPQNKMSVKKYYTIN